jgi:hypothetical protein
MDRIKFIELILHLLLIITVAFAAGMVAAQQLRQRVERLEYIVGLHPEAPKEGLQWNIK